MQIVMVNENENIEINRIKIRDIYSDEALIRVKYSGICGSDVHAFNGKHPFRKPPVSLGHEVVGEIIEVGSISHSHLLGKRVSVNPQISCGNCMYCKDKKDNLCENRVAPGVGNWEGTMAEYFIAPINKLIELPDIVTYEDGVLIEPLAVAFHALEISKVNNGHKVGIFGVGTIGLLILTVLKNIGNEVDVATDIKKTALDKALEIGAKNVLNVSNHEEKLNFIENNKGKFDVIFITAESTHIVDEALRLLKNGGKVITVSMFNRKQSIDISQLQMTEKVIKGCMTYSDENFSQALDYIIKNKDLSHGIITHVLPFNEAQEAFDMVSENHKETIKVILEF